MLFSLCLKELVLLLVLHEKVVIRSKGGAQKHHLSRRRPYAYCNQKNPVYNRLIKNEAFLIESER